jgi:hypothetical protein
MGEIGQSFEMGLMENVNVMESNAVNRPMALEKNRLSRKKSTITLISYR